MRGEMNPQTWPPLRDTDAFEVTGSEAPVGDAAELAPTPVPKGATIDDLD